MKRFMALAVVAVAMGAFTSSASAAGCGLSSTGGTVTRTLGSRVYQLHAPQGLTGKQVPLLLSLHGAGSNGSEDEYFTGWSGFADQHNFIVAYPDAQGYPSGVWDPYTPSSPDVGFLRLLVSDISASWCVDPHRIYVDGWSNGAVMSQRAACNAADEFAAVTSYAGGDPTAVGGAAPCKPSRPIGVGLIVGQQDFTFAGLAQNTSQWAGIDSCGPTPAHETDQYGPSDTYSCSAGTQVLSRVVSNTSHNWPSGAQGADQRSRMWAFYGANSLP